jgi:hypothetical protein
MSRCDRLKSAGDVGLLSRVVSMLCEVTIDNGTRTTIEAMLAELAPTVEEMRRCENHDELVVIFIRLRTQVVGRDGEIDRLLVLLADVGERPVDREQLVAECQREHAVAREYVVDKPFAPDRDRLRQAHRLPGSRDEHVPVDLFADQARRNGAPSKREKQRVATLFRRRRTLSRDGDSVHYERRQAERMRMLAVVCYIVTGVIALVAPQLWPGLLFLASLGTYLRGQASVHRNNHRFATITEGLTEQEKVDLAKPQLKKAQLFEQRTADSILATIKSLIRRNQG